MTSCVVPKSSFAFETSGEAVQARGLTTATMAGPAQGSVHMEASLSRLSAGGSIPGHFHVFEESFYILSGEVLVNINGRSHLLRENDFGVVPAAVHHAWHNVSSSEATWFRMRSPQPRTMYDGSNGTYISDQIEIPTDGASVGDLHPAIPYVGHFAEHHLPSPGPIGMRGYRGPNVDSVAIWMLVDDMIGALHHTMFIVQFVPGASTHPHGDHFHPFEEAYYFTHGSAIAHLEGGDIEVHAGDLVFAGTNAMHGYTMTGDVPTRWIEVQTPAPTPAGAFVFPAEWEQFAPE